MYLEGKNELLHIQQLVKHVVGSTKFWVNGVKAAGDPPKSLSAVRCPHLHVFWRLATNSLQMDPPPENFSHLLEVSLAQIIIDAVEKCCWGYAQG